MSTPSTTRERALSDGPEPVVPGFWMTVLGAAVAVLGPLTGFLGGSITGGSAEDASQLAVWLMVGLVVGGLGVLCAFIGGARWWRHEHS